MTNSLVHDEVILKKWPDFHEFCCGCLRSLTFFLASPSGQCVYLFQIQFHKTRLDFRHVCKANKCPDSLENGHGHKLKGGQQKFLCLHYCTVALIKDGCVRSLLHGCMWEYLQDVCTSLGGAGRNAPCTASQFCR